MLPVREPDRLGPRKEFRRLHVQRQCNALQGVNRKGFVRPFDQTDVGSMQAGAKSKFLLAEAPLLTKTPNLSREGRTQQRLFDGRSHASSVTHTAGRVFRL